MAENPDLLVRVSTPDGLFTVPAAVAERAGWKVTDRPATDKVGRPITGKLRVHKGTRRPPITGRTDLPVDTEE